MSTLNTEAVIFWAEKLKDAQPGLFADQKWDGIPQSYLAPLLLSVLTPQNVAEHLLYPVLKELLDGVQEELDMHDWEQQQELLSKITTANLDRNADLFSYSAFNPIGGMKNKTDMSLDPEFFYLSLLKDFKKTIFHTSQKINRERLKNMIADNESVLCDHNEIEKIRHVYVMDGLWKHSLFGVEYGTGLASIKTGINRIFSVAFQVVEIPSSKIAFACWLNLLESFFQLKYQLN